jgi:hypothetical protein
MGFKDLNKLGKKENKIFLILVIWLLIAFTLFSFNIPGIFEIPFIIGLIVFVPLVGLSLLLSLIKIFSEKDIKDLSFGKYALYCFIGFLIVLIFNNFVLLLMILGILSYIFLTALFTLWSCYENGSNWDEKIYKWPSPINHLARWGQYIILPVIAAVLIAVAVMRGGNWAIASPEIANFYVIVAWSILGLCGLLWFLSFWFIFTGKLNSWLGVFFIWVALYTYYLMISAFYGLTRESGPSGTIIGGDIEIIIQIVLYIFDLLVILSVIGKLIGQRSETLSKTLHMKEETLLIWLIFSKAAFEFAEIMPGTQTGLLKAVLVFVLFVPLILITGLFGMIHYFKVKKGMKTKKKDKKKEKKLKKTGIKCEKCGKYNREEAQFCRSCGKELK